MSDHAETHNPPVSCYEQVGYCVNPLVVQTLLLLLLVFCVVLIICNWNNEYKSTPPPSSCLAYKQELMLHKEQHVQICSSRPLLLLKIYIVESELNDVDDFMEY